MKRLVFICVVVLALVGLASAGLQYKTTDLGTLGGPESFAYDINDAGQVVGAATPEMSDMVPFIWTKESGMRSLGDLRGYSYGSGWARAINELGEVTGWAEPGCTYPFRWTEKTGMVALEEPGWGRGINDFGEIVCSISGNRDWNAAVWTPDRRTVYFGPAPIDMDMGSVPQAINNDGLVVGFEQFHWAHYPRLWAPDGFKVCLPVPGDWGGAARAINDSGVIVGYYGGDAVMWTPNYVYMSLGTLAEDGFTAACDINDTNTVVGYCCRNFEGCPRWERAFVWTRETGIQELPMPWGFRNAEAWAINNHSQIVGVAWDQDDLRHAILWEPMAGW